MYNDKECQEACSISQLADNLCISRTRVYQYIKAHVFPPPLSCPFMKNRPFYTYELQKKCATILRTGIAYDGQLMVFNTKRKRRTTRGHITPKKRRVNLYQSLMNIMKQIGIDVTINDVKEAVKIVSPAAVITNEPDKELITAVYNHFRPNG